MSAPTSPPRRFRYRRPLRALAAALVVGASCLAIVATAVPFDAAAKKGGNGGGNGLDPDVEDMKEAFEDYIQSLEAMAASFVDSDTFTLDEAHSVGAYDLITAFMQSAARQNIGSSGAGRGRPRFSGFDDPDTRIGVDNPDTQYMGSIVNNSDCTQSFRVWGNRGNTVDFILTTFDTSSGTGGGPTLEDEDMVNLNGDPLQLNEDWEVYAACPDIIAQHPEWLNTLALPVSERLQIARRHTHCDWTVEHPEEVHIERLGTGGVPSPPLSAEVMAKQLRAGIFLNETQAPFWPAFVDSIKGALPVNTATPWQPTGGLGITTQYNMFMWFDAGDDPEAAVIIRLPDEDIAAYMGLQLSNFWGSSADWANRHVSMNWGLDGSCQAEQSAPTFHPAQQLISANGGPFCGQQDAYFIVISAADPGVQNWVETAELSEGLIAARLQSVSAPIQDVAGLGSCMLPVAIPVPGPGAFPFPTDLATRVQIVLGQVGATATPATPQDRADTIQMRQDFVREKYIFW
jgi:hypothetical protein